MASNNDQAEWNNEEDADIAMAQDSMQSQPNITNHTTDQITLNAEPRADMADGSFAWQPSPEEIAAATAWEQAQADAQSGDSQFTAQQLLQQQLDHEMALQFDALENGAGYSIALPWNDVDMPPETFECACGDTYNYSQLAEGQAIVLPCAHARCKSCLNENVRVGLSSRMNYPPKCCGPFDVADIIDHLEDDVRATWLEKREEYDDVAPVYCAVKECSKYLTKDQLIEDGRWAVCDSCNVKTCTGCLCLQSAHEVGSAECPERIDKMDKDLMVKQGWKACPRCGNMIERTEGCDHMMCDCGQEFCYSCGRLLQGAIPCNCSGQRDWVNEGNEDNDPQAQQQIMDAINRARNGGFDDLDTEDEFADDVDDMDDYGHQEDMGDMGNDEEAISGDEGHEEDEEGEEEEEHEEGEAGAHTTAHPDSSTATHGARLIRIAIRTLHLTDPELAVRMDLMSRVQAHPYTLSGFAADARRVQQMSGEAFANEMRSLETALGPALLDANAREQAMAWGEHE